MLEEEREIPVHMNTTNRGTVKGMKDDQEISAERDGKALK